MDWNTLLSVAVGGLIATIGSILNNRFQSRERDKDRQEQRKEARTQSREKWIEKDILKIMDSVEQILEALRCSDDSMKRLENLAVAKNAGLFTQEEFDEQKKSYYINPPDDKLKITQLFATVSHLTYSFEDENILRCYIQFESAQTELFKKETEYFMAKIGGETEGIHPPLSEQVKLNRAAGEFRNALRERLISIRETA